MTLVELFPSQNIKYDDHILRYANTNLNVRKNPKIDSEIIKVLKINEMVITTDSIVKGFYLILKKDSTKFGWASESYLQINPISKNDLVKLKEQEEKTIVENTKNEDIKIERKNPSMYKSDASYYAHEKILELLVSPATADFGLWDEKAIKWNDGTYYGYTIKGYVDSQNGFGAIIRTKYSVNIGKNINGDIAASTPILN